MKLIFVRHGQTDYNKEGRPQGQEIDAPLNETGIRQAKEAAKSVPSDIDCIIASPLKRAAETAEILNSELDATIAYDDDVKEIHYGSLAGRTWSEIAETTNDTNAKRRDDTITFDYTKWGGDRADDLKSRVQGFVERMQEEYPDKTILVVSHGGVIDAMHILFPQQERRETDHATIHEFCF